MFDISGKIVIFGASVLGKTVLDFLRMLDREPVCFADNDPVKRLKLFHGVRVVSFDELRNMRNIQTVIAADRYFNAIREQLQNAGLNNFYTCSDVFAAADWSGLDPVKTKSALWVLAKRNELGKVMEIPETALHIPRLNIVITTKCTLKCKHCSSLIPLYAEHRDLSVEKIKSDFDTLFGNLDMVYHAELLGGEPFLHRGITEIVRFLMESHKLLHLDIVTNGTVLPSAAVISKLRYDNLSVVIDDYGKYSSLLDELSSLLDSEKIDWRVNRHWAWADLGGFENRNRSEFESESLFSKCNFNSCAEMIDGRLFRCPRSSHGTRLGVIPCYPSDFIEIKSLKNDSDAKEKLKDFFSKKTLEACNHCSGNYADTLVLNAAEQIGEP